MEFIILVIVGALVWRKMNKQINALTARVAVIEQGKQSKQGEFAQNVDKAESATLSTFGQAPVSDPVPTLATASAIASNSAQNIVQSKQGIVQQFGKWVARDWPMKMGSFMLIIAVGWFVTHAFANDWIGPVGRVSLGLLFGIVVLSSGMMRVSISQIQGNVLMVIGAVTMLLTMLAATGLYQMFPETITLLVMLGVVTLMMSQVIAQRNIALGLVTLLLGAIVPFFMVYALSVNTIFLYLFVLVAGTLWVSWKMPQRVLSVVALGIVIFYAIILGMLTGFENTITNVAFAVAMTLLFYITNIVTMVRTQVVGRADVVVAGGTGMLFWLMMTIVLPEQSVSIALIVGALAAVGGAFVLYEVARAKAVNAVIVYSAVALTLLAVATALELKGNALVVAYAVEFGTLLGVVLYLSVGQGKNLLGRFGGVLYLVPVLLSLGIIGGLFYKIKYGVLNFEKTMDASYGAPMGIVLEPVTLLAALPELFVITVIGVIAGIVGVIAAWGIGQVKDSAVQKIFLANMRFFWGIFGVYAMILIWAVIHIVIGVTSIATMIALTIYTVVGVSFYISGAQNQYMPYRVVAGLLFTVVLMRLFFVEFWGMSIIAKIVTFFVIGVLFVSTSFLAKSSRDDKLSLS